LTLKKFCYIHIIRKSGGNREGKLSHNKKTEAKEVLMIYPNEVIFFNPKLRIPELQYVPPVKKIRFIITANTICDGPVVVTYFESEILKRVCFVADALKKRKGCIVFSYSFDRKQVFPVLFIRVNMQVFDFPLLEFVEKFGHPEGVKKNNFEPVKADVLSGASIEISCGAFFEVFSGGASVPWVIKEDKLFGREFLAGEAEFVVEVIG
jgi:hypothetical protein